MKRTLPTPLHPVSRRSPFHGTRFSVTSIGDNVEAIHELLTRQLGVLVPGSRAGGAQYYPGCNARGLLLPFRRLGPPSRCWSAADGTFANQHIVAFLKGDPPRPTRWIAESGTTPLTNRVMTIHPARRRIGPLNPAPQAKQKHLENLVKVGNQQCELPENLLSY